MEITIQQIAGRTIARLNHERLDAAQSVRFKENLRELSDGGADHIILDMSEVSFMDSSGLGAVVAVFKHMGKNKTLELAALSPAVGKVFALTRMDRIFSVYPTVEAALSNVKMVRG